VTAQRATYAGTATSPTDVHISPGGCGRDWLAECDPRPGRDLLRSCNEHRAADGPRLALRGNDGSGHCPFVADAGLVRALRLWLSARAKRKPRVALVSVEDVTAWS
jgi:hypothetical protein